MATSVTCSPLPRGLGCVADAFARDVAQKTAALFPGVSALDLRRQALSIFGEWLAFGPHRSHRCPRFLNWDGRTAALTLWRRIRAPRHVDRLARAIAAFPASLVRIVRAGVTAYAAHLARAAKREFDASGWDAAPSPAAKPADKWHATANAFARHVAEAVLTTTGKTAHGSAVREAVTRAALETLVHWIERQKRRFPDHDSVAFLLRRVALAESAGEPPFTRWPATLCTVVRRACVRVACRAAKRPGAKIAQTVEVRA